MHHLFRLKKPLGAILFIALIPYVINGQNRSAIICGQLIDGTSPKPLQNHVILIEDERIVKIGTREIIPPGTETIDLSNYTILPGFIDAHAHADVAGDDYQIQHLKNSSAAKALHGLKVVQGLLNAGWTTLRMAGDADIHYAILEVRNAIERGDFDGPRIVGAGHWISATGGGGDINFISPEQPLIADGLIVDGIDEMRKAVREEIKYGSDWIKLLVSGAFMSAGDNPKDVHFSHEELNVAVQEAHRRSVPVMAHAHSTEGIKIAVKAGVRSIEHGTFIDEEGMDLMIRHGTYLIPTIFIGEYFLSTYQESEALSKAISLEREYREEYLRSYALAFKKGVKIGLGTDYVGWSPELSAREFESLTNIGMTPMQAIQAGTKVNAELLGLINDIGTLEPGKIADIVAVMGDPLSDISSLQRVKFVMARGRIIRLDPE